MTTVPTWKRESLSSRQLTSQEMFNLRIEGATYREIGEKAKVTGERVRQILQKEEVGCRWFTNAIEANVLDLLHNERP